MGTNKQRLNFDDTGQLQNDNGYLFPFKDNTMFHLSYQSKVFFQVKPLQYHLEDEELIHLVILGSLYILGMYEHSH